MNCCICGRHTPGGVVIGTTVRDDGVDAALVCCVESSAMMICSGASATAGFSDSDDEEDSGALKAQRQKIERYFAKWNGEWWKPCPVHYCRALLPLSEADHIGHAAVLRRDAFWKKHKAVAGQHMEQVGAGAWLDSDVVSSTRYTHQSF